MFFRLNRRRLFVGSLVVLGAIVLIWYSLLRRPSNFRDYNTVEQAWNAPKKETDEENNESAQCCLEVAQHILVRSMDLLPCCWLRWPSDDGSWP